MTIFFFYNRESEYVVLLEYSTKKKKKRKKKQLFVKLGSFGTESGESTEIPDSDRQIIAQTQVLLCTV